MCIVYMQLIILVIYLASEVVNEAQSDGNEVQLDTAFIMKTAFHKGSLKHNLNFWAQK